MSKNSSTTRPSVPQGTRDFPPEVVRKREYILDTVKIIFRLYGFQPLETPAMENLETLMGKYGEEGDKLIFKILNNGLNDPKNAEKSKAAFENVLQGKNDRNLTERALRYDLTIPFARFVAMNQHQLVMPFKRYQVQPVWRADRPQKGRYREFYQCDADIVGSTSLLNELELANIYKDVFEKLGLPVEIRINSRKILAALADLVGGADKLTDITIAIDKLDKVGMDKVKEELVGKGISNEQVLKIETYLNISGTNEQRVTELHGLLGNTSSGQTGIAEIRYLMDNFISTSNCKLVADFTLARGLNYYTGMIYEVKAAGVQMGSIGGGGRYDDLTGLFGVPGIPGVGISFGVDRIYDVLEELQLFPARVEKGTSVLFFNLGENEARAAYQIVGQLRAKGIAAELYHETAKLDKQFKYAEKKGIPVVAILGSRELEQKQVNIKILATGKQHLIDSKNISSFLEQDFTFAG